MNSSSSAALRERDSPSLRKHLGLAASNGTCPECNGPIGQALNAFEDRLFIGLDSGEVTGAFACLPDWKFECFRVIKVARMYPLAFLEGDKEMMTKFVASLEELHSSPSLCSVLVRTSPQSPTLLEMLDVGDEKSGVAPPTTLRKDYLP
jgi:hypothetical protein